MNLRILKMISKLGTPQRDMRDRIHYSWLAFARINVANRRF